MKIILLRIAMVCFSLGVATLGGQNLGSYAIRNVTVIPMDRDGSLPDQTVVVENGVITQIGDARTVKPKKGIIGIDAKGKFLMPGLFDMHAHFFTNRAPLTSACCPGKVRWKPASRPI